MIAFAATVLFSFYQADDLQDLEHRDPEVRALAARVAGRKKLSTAVGRLARLTTDENVDVRKAATEALVAITDRKDVADWNQWWLKEGRNSYPEASVSETRMRQMVSDEVKMQGVTWDDRMVRARQDIRMMTAFMAVALVLFLAMMIFFVGHVSAKIKGWRDLVTKAEVYIKQSQELTERTDRIGAEIEARKVDLVKFVTKLREENESLLDHHLADAQKGVQNAIRDEAMGLRRAAEKELEQTVADLKTQLEIESRRAAAEMRDRMAK